MKYRTLIIAILAASVLSSCALVYKPVVQQGNIIPDVSVSKLHSGMTVDQVTELLGSPVDVQIFAANKMTYAYFLEPKRHQGPVVRKNLIITFNRGIISSWNYSN
jgi:outer membrane protein assembly factor BamE (lipoprotein component of BamABCDE complex)